MSITDIAAGRMGSAPARSFGTRRVPPARSRPQPVRRPALFAGWFAAWLAVWTSAWPAASWSAAWPVAWFAAQSTAWLAVSRFLARLPGLLLQKLQSLARSAASALKPSEACSREAAVQTVLRSNASATSVRLLAYVGALAVLAVGAAHVVRSNPAGMDIEPAPRVEWIEVTKPFPAFSLPLSELADRPDYALRRHATGGGRQDILTWTALEGETPHLMVEIYRPAAEFEGFEAPEREIAARIDAAAFKPAGMMETKFGPVSLVEFSLRQPARQCLGFVRHFETPQLQILGWHCTRGPEAVERDLAACALDRLALLAAGSEPKVRELFARAELKRNFCGQRSPLLTATPKLGPSKPAPDSKLRGRISSPAEPASPAVNDLLRRTKRG